MGLADGLATEIKAETTSEAAAGDHLTSRGDGKLHDAIVELLEIGELENSILHEETQRV